MKTPTALAPSSSGILTTSHQRILGAQIDPNPWNPNRMTAAMEAKLYESITEYGMVDPLTVREYDNSRFQVLDGENRWRVATSLGHTIFECTVVEGLTDAQAKKLTIIMNELHGQADPGRMGDLLTDIMKLTSLDEMLHALPYDESIVAGFMGSAAPLPTLEPLTKPAASGEAKEVWAERLFRMPKSVALIVDEALEKAKDGEEIESWQALERVAADYLAS